MTQVLALLARVLGLLLDVLGLAQTINDATKNAALEHAPYALETIAANGTNTVIHPTHGNAALLAAIQAIGGGAGPTIQDILDAIAALPAGSSIPTAAGNAYAVWQQPLYGSSAYWGVSADNVVNASAAWANTMDQTTRLGLVQAPDFSVDFRGNGKLWNTGPVAAPNPDYTDIRVDDNPATWLNRTDSVGRTWLYDATLDLAYSYDHMGAGDTWNQLWCNLHTQDLQRIRTQAAAPVWPGIAAVTLGAPVALSSDLELAGPMDGVILAITTPPTGLGKFQIGARTWWYRLGQISFVSDNGEVEPWQYLAWDQSVYCPRQMAHADSALIRCLAGAEGTVTPWVLA